MSLLGRLFGRSAPGSRPAATPVARGLLCTDSGSFALWDHAGFEHDGSGYLPPFITYSLEDSLCPR